MKRRKRYRLPALARGLYYAGLHLTGGFLGERQRKNIFTGKGCVRLQQVTDALRNDARFSGPRSCNHEKRSLAVGDRPTLRVIELQTALSQRLHFEQRRHDSRRVSDFSWK